MAFSTSKKGPKSVAAPKPAKFLHGTWPVSARIKPLTGQTQYGKVKPQISPTESGGGFGATMEPQEP